MNLTVLRAAIDQAPYVSVSDSHVVADMLNTSDRPSYRVLAPNELLLWSAQGGRLAELKKGMAKTNGAVASVCEAAYLLITRESADFDLKDPAIIGAIDVLVADGTLTAADKTSLQAMATTTISHAEELGLPSVRGGDVIRARAL